MTTLAVQRPRIEHVPDYVGTAGAEAIDLAAMAGLALDPWQAMVLEHSLGERPDGKWAAFEVGVNVPRQNGKGGLLEARELAGLFLLGERLLIHSAHQFDTSLEAFRRLLLLIEETPELARRIKRVSRAHGEEGIELIGSQRIRFRTRTKGGGRGFSGDCLILDEAMILPEAGYGALLPTLSARPNPQVWYTGSAVDQTIHEHGVVWARVRERGMAGADPSLAYFEWSAHGDDPAIVPEQVAGDQEVWAAANPALGIRVSAEHVARERRAMDPRTFAVERLGIGDWPVTDQGAGSLIPVAAWLALLDESSSMTDPVCFAFDVAPDRSVASIAAAGRREDGEVHVELIDRRGGTGWVAGRLAELADKWSPGAVLCDGHGPANALVEDIAAAGVQVTALPSADYVKACGMLFDLVDQRRVHHRGGDALTAAIRGAATRPLVDAWAWSRKASKLDITPLVAVSIAAWHAAVALDSPTPFVI